MKEFSKNSPIFFVHSILFRFSINVYDSCQNRNSTKYNKIEYYRISGYARKAIMKFRFEMNFHFIDLSPPMPRLISYRAEIFVIPLTSMLNDERRKFALNEFPIYWLNSDESHRGNLISSKESRGSTVMLRRRASRRIAAGRIKTQRWVIKIAVAVARGNFVSSGLGSYRVAGGITGY